MSIFFVIVCRVLVYILFDIDCVDILGNGFLIKNYGVKFIRIGLVLFEGKVKFVILNI